MERKIFDENTGIITLETLNTAYAFKIVSGKYVAHLYYGEKNGRVGDYSARPLAFASYTENEEGNFYFETTKAEYPFFGTGDFGADALRIRNKNGNNATYFEYDAYRVFNGREEIKNLPYAETEKEDYTVLITYKDVQNNLVLKTYYTVFYNHDVISRYVVLENNGDSSVFIENAKSLSLDFPCSNFDLVSLYGAHYFERTVQRVNLAVGKSIISSDRGASSHHFNPFIALCESNADYVSGGVYGFNFVYSGSFENVVEKTGNRVRVLVGINGAVEGHRLDAGERYYSPEAVMTYSKEGLGGMSRNFHKFVKGCIVPKKYIDYHPIVLNTWEAFYFDIDEAKLLNLADQAVKVGIDTLVVDDGWFSIRNGDNAGLGDWWVNEKKFPSGLKEFSKKINDKGLKFGIWIEPEMVNPDSELYKNHPEWCLLANNRPLTLSRNQLVLNMALPEVRDYLKESFKNTFDGVKLSYIKWDMNRSLSTVGGNYEGADDNNIYRRFMEGVYDLHKWFNENYPSVIIEGCSGGGGRYDLGMMKYVGQIWASDNTFPADRARIQHGTLMAYPTCMMSCHVSNPNNALDNEEEMDYRYKVACAGVLGYEMDLISVSDKIKKGIKEQIEEYLTFKQTILNGEYYPVKAQNERYIYYYYDKENGKIVLQYQTQQVGEKEVVKFVVADSNENYILKGCDKKYSGEQLQLGVEIDLKNKADVLIFEKED